MNTKRSFYVIFTIFILLILSSISVIAQDDEQTEFHLRGTVVQRIGQYPDNFSYDGSDVVDLEQPGFFEMHLDAENNVGLMFSRFYVESYQLNADTLLEDAQITVIFPLFGAPTGIMPDYWEGGIATDVLLHGDSGHEAPVLPTVFNDVASWGPALVFVDGEQLMGAEEIMGAPNIMGAFAGHMMYSNEVRDPETGLVANAEGDGSYSPMVPSDGIAYEDSSNLFHLIVRTEVRDDAAFPPFSMFMHFNFLEIEEIDALEMEMDFPTFESLMGMMEGMEMEAMQEQMGQMVGDWLMMADMVEEALAEAAESD